MQGIDGIIKFQKDRLLDQQMYSGINEQINILEELFESAGLDISKENRSKFIEDFLNFIETEEHKGIATKQKELSHDDIVDAYGDIIVFALGAIMKLGYDPKLVLKEVSKEINSRTGSIVNGKLEKDLSTEAKAKWYKADFSTAHLTRRETS